MTQAALFVAVETNQYCWIEYGEDYFQKTLFENHFGQSVLIGCFLEIVSGYGEKAEADAGDLTE